MKSRTPKGLAIAGMLTYPQGCNSMKQLMNYQTNQAIHLEYIHCSLGDNDMLAELTEKP